MKFKKNGFTLTELVVAISLFTILIVFLSSSIYYLLAEFKNLGFKSQEIFLAQQKLDEYQYCAQEESKTIAGKFNAPFDSFFYAVDLTDDDDNFPSSKLITVNVWTGTENIMKNKLQLTGLANKTTTPGFPFPKDLSSPIARIYFDPSSNQIILEEAFGGQKMWRGYKEDYLRKSSRYSLDGKKRWALYTESYIGRWDYEVFFGWAYNVKINQLLGITTNKIDQKKKVPAGVQLLREKDPLQEAYVSSSNLTNDGYSHENIMIDIENALASTSDDGTTYLVQKTEGNGAGTAGAKIWICKPTEEGALDTTKVINVSNYSKEGWNSDLSEGLGFTPTNLTDIRIDSFNNVILTLNYGKDSSIVQYDKNIDNLKILFPPKVEFQDGEKQYMLSATHIEKDKSGNIYVMPSYLAEKQKNGNWEDIELRGYVEKSLYWPLLKFKETGRDESGNPILAYKGKATDFASVIDFTISPDGEKLITIEGKSAYPINDFKKHQEGPPYYIYVNIYQVGN